MKIGVTRGQKQSDKRKSAGVSTLLCANWLKNCVCKVIFLLSSYSVQRGSLYKERTCKGYEKLTDVCHSEERKGRFEFMKVFTITWIIMQVINDRLGLNVIYFGILFIFVSKNQIRSST